MSIILLIDYLLILDLKGFADYVLVDKQIPQFYADVIAKSYQSLGKLIVEHWTLYVEIEDSLAPVLAYLKVLIRVFIVICIDEMELFSVVGYG
jgi:hypothetical protein